MKKALKYSLYVIGWFLIGVVVLIIAAGLLIQTQPVKKKIAAFAETKASEILNGEISIGEIKGNFFTSLGINNILWTQGGDTLAYIAEFKADYELRPLLTGELLIHNAQISKPYFYLEQNKDSTWNVQYLVKPQEDNQEDEGASGDFKINISNFEIEEGQVRINTSDTIIPEKVNHLNSKLSLRYSSNAQKVELSNLSFETLNPSFVLEKLSFDAARNSGEIELRDFYLKTAKNKLEGKADYVTDSLINASANLEVAPLHLNEFEFFLSGFKLSVSPTLQLETEVENGKLNASITIADGDQNIVLDLHSENFGQFLNDTSEVQLEYNVNGDISNIDLSHWLGDPKLNYLINGKLKIEGKGTDPKTATISLDGDFKDIIIHEKPVDKLLASLHLENGNLSGNIEGNGNFGIVKITPNIRDLQGTPSYQLNLTAEKFNLAELTGNDSLHSDINLTAKIKGRNFEPEKIDAQTNLQISKSRFQDVVLDSLVGIIQYRNKNIQIDSLWAKTQSISLDASGNYNLEGSSDLWLQAKFSGLEEFTPFIPAESLHAEGNIDARLKGSSDSIDVSAKLDLNDVRYDDFIAEGLLVTANGQLTKHDTTIGAQVLVNEFRMRELLLDSVNFDANYSRDSLHVDGRVTGEGVKTNLAAGLKLGSRQRISLENWGIDYKNQHFELQNPPAVLELDSVQYQISNFKLVSDDSDSSQFIMADGVISRTGDENFQLEVANINIQKILEMSGIDFGASGILDVTAEIKGTATSPLVNGKFVIDGAVLNEYKFTDFSGNIGLKNNRLNTDIRIVPEQQGRLKLTGEFPMLAELDSMKFNFNPKDSLAANLIIEQFPLAVLQNIEIAREIKGYIEGSVDVSGTLESPDPKGNIHLVDASLEVPEYGIDYENIVLNLKFLPEAVQLDSFYIKSEDGTMEANGTVDFSSAFYKGDISQSKIDVKFHNFNPVNHRQFNMQLSGDANLQGKKGEVVFGGDLNIPESELYLPAIFNMMGQMSAPEIPDPILVREMKNMELYNDSLSFQQDTVEADTFNFSYFDDFTGSLNLKIPKNSWIKNKDMHIEISGDLELRKNKDFFELFGSVDVVRGQYDLLGKTFIIDDGTINFQGGEELMPRIDITASYSFRNAERAEQKLTVQVTGTAEEPNVNFNLDGSNISEGDALSYILFGKSLDELSIDQQQNVAGAGSLAGTAAAAILSSQLTNFLGEKLDVDYIEIKSNGGDFDNATVVVGKYITNDLFVSYEQRFGETDEKEMAKYEVKLEYELFKFLFLQLNNSSNDSGFDVIFKFNSQ